MSNLLVNSAVDVLPIVQNMVTQWQTLFQSRDRVKAVQIIEQEIEYVRQYPSAWMLMTKNEHEKLFMNIGTSAMTLVRDYDQLKFADLLVQKHKAYGAEPLRRWGPLGVVIRIDSKMARYVNLTTKQLTKVEDIIPENESTNDTITDILGYAVLGVLLVRDNAKGV